LGRNVISVDYKSSLGSILTNYQALADHAPVIVFGKGCWFALNEMGKSRASALGVDWTFLRNARYLSGGNITLQNFDPSRLLSQFRLLRKWYTK
jgi:uroporphyrinogen decarboxylase